MGKEGLGWFREGLEMESFSVFVLTQCLMCDEKVGIYFIEV